MRAELEAQAILNSVRIGVIADTHGLLRPEAIAALRGSDFIIHAGDIDEPVILETFSALAPVTAVRGNVDRGTWAEKLPTSAVLEVGGVSIYVIHNLQELDLKPEAAGFAAVIYGHTHIPTQENKKGVLYVNPGSAGPRRFQLPVSVGRLEVRNAKVTVEFMELNV